MNVVQYPSSPFNFSVQRRMICCLTKKMKKPAGMECNYVIIKYKGTPIMDDVCAHYKENNK